MVGVWLIVIGLLRFMLHALLSVTLTLAPHPHRDSKWDRIQLECVRCLKSIMNSTVGLKQMLEQKEALTILARSIDPARPQASQLLLSGCTTLLDNVTIMLGCVVMWCK